MKFLAGIAVAAIAGSVQAASPWYVIDPLVGARCVPLALYARTSGAPTSAASSPEVFVQWARAHGAIIYFTQEGDGGALAWDGVGNGILFAKGHARCEMDRASVLTMDRDTRR